MDKSGASTPAVVGCPVLGSARPGGGGGGGGGTTIARDVR